MIECIEIKRYSKRQDWQGKTTKDVVSFSSFYIALYLYTSHVKTSVFLILRHNLVVWPPRLLETLDRHLRPSHRLSQAASSGLSSIWKCRPAFSCWAKQHFFHKKQHVMQIHTSTGVRTYNTGQYNTTMFDIMSEIIEWLTSVLPYDRLPLCVCRARACSLSTCSAVFSGERVLCLFQPKQHRKDS